MKVYGTEGWAKLDTQTIHLWSFMGFVNTNKNIGFITSFTFYTKNGVPKIHLSIIIMFHPSMYLNTVHHFEHFYTVYKTCFFHYMLTMWTIKPWAKLHPEKGFVGTSLQNCLSLRSFRNMVIIKWVPLCSLCHGRNIRAGDWWTSPAALDHTFILRHS